MSDVLLTTLIAVIAGLVGGYLTGRYASDLERVKWERSRREDYEKETRLVVVALARKLGEAANSMEWVTWTAEHQPSGLPESEIKAYNDRMYQLWPDIVGAHLVVAAYSTPMYTKMTPLVNMVQDLDSAIAKVLERGGAAEYFDAARKTHDELTKQVGEILAASFRSADLA